MTPEYVASQFESLGGGSLNKNGWAFGCEFGFWQRSLQVEPLGLLRWASIAPADLQRGLECQFSDVDNPSSIVARNAGPLWAITQTTHGIYLDHTGMKRSEVSSEDAAKKMALKLGFLRRKLLEDIAAREKIFVYRTYDHTMRDDAVAALADALGDATLLYVRIAQEGETPFAARRVRRNLIIGTIDRFAPQPGRLDYNSSGWEAVCRAALREKASVDGWREAVGRFAYGVTGFRPDIFRDDAVSIGHGADKIRGTAVSSAATPTLAPHPSPNSRIDSAVAMHEAGDTPGAVAILLAVPDDLNSLAQSSHLFAMWDMPERALAMARRISPLYPDHPSGPFHVSRALRRLGRNAEAEILLRDAPVRWAEHDGILSIWASLPMNRGAWDEALERWDMLIERFPDSSKFPITKARCLIFAGRLDDSGEILREVAMKYPGARGYEIVVGELETARTRHAASPQNPDDNRDVLITGAVGSLGAVEIMAWWDGADWIAAHGEQISSVRSWREMELAPISPAPVPLLPA